MHGSGGDKGEEINREPLPRKHEQRAVPAMEVLGGI